MTQDHEPAGVAKRQFGRRRFLTGATLITGAALAGYGSPYSADASSRPTFAHLLAQMDLATPESIASYEPIALSPAELATLAAAVGRVIPADDLGPGAAEAGAHIYIDQALGGNSAALLPLFQGGLAALDTAAAGGSFAALSADDQDAILTQAEAGTIDGMPDSFFTLLVYNTRSGMFSDPVHGGNINFIGWDLLQYPGIKLVWTQEEQAFDADVKPLHISVAQFGGTK